MSAADKKDFVVTGRVSEKTCQVMKEELKLFPFLDDADMADMPCYFELKRVKAGEVVCREGDPCKYVAFIIDGRLEIKKETEFQGKQFVLGIYSKGAIVGELCILDEHPRAVTAVALEDSTLVIISHDNLDLMLEERPDIGVKFLKGLLLAVSIRLRKSFDRMASIF